MARQVRGRVAGCMCGGVRGGDGLGGQVKQGDRRGGRGGAGELPAERGGGLEGGAPRLGGGQAGGWQPGEGAGGREVERARDRRGGQGGGGEGQGRRGGGAVRQEGEGGAPVPDPLAHHDGLDPDRLGPGVPEVVVGSHGQVGGRAERVVPEASRPEEPLGLGIDLQLDVVDLVLGGPAPLVQEHARDVERRVDAEVVALGLHGDVYLHRGADEQPEVGGEVPAKLAGRDLQHLPRLSAGIRGAIVLGHAN
mmetsp:Transcript_87017/g.151427  ORF Transcript_87017/g.151427 Transcript_87017/m.151427 type:complete len:251 (+) Transcript_87017:895-1647(+)